MSPSPSISNTRKHRSSSPGGGASGPSKHASASNTAHSLSQPGPQGRHAQISNDEHPGTQCGGIKGAQLSSHAAWPGQSTGLQRVGQLSLQKLDPSPQSGLQKGSQISGLHMLPEHVTGLQDNGQPGAQASPPQIGLQRGSMIGLQDKSQSACSVQRTGLQRVEQPSPQKPPPFPHVGLHSASHNSGLQLLSWQVTMSHINGQSRPHGFPPQSGLHCGASGGLHSASQAAFSGQKSGLHRVEQPSSQKLPPSPQVGLHSASQISGLQLLS